MYCWKYDGPPLVGRTNVHGTSYQVNLTTPSGMGICGMLGNTWAAPATSRTICPCLAVRMFSLGPPVIHVQRLYSKVSQHFMATLAPVPVSSFQAMTWAPPKSVLLTMG